MAALTCTHAALSFLLHLNPLTLSLIILLLDLFRMVILSLWFSQVLLLSVPTPLLLDHLSIITFILFFFYNKLLTFFLT